LWICLTAVLSCAWLLSGSAAELGQDRAQAKLRTFFAFEHEIWQETTGSKLVLQTPKKHPDNPVIARGTAPAADSHRLSYTSLFPEDGRLRA
jgi:hypothetical protein